MIILLSLLLPAAFAITNFDGCEAELILDAKHTITLAPDQIAVRGRLGHFDEQGHDDETKTWIVTDSFIHEEVAPRIDTEIFWLGENDYVYLLDDLGHVVAHGHYTEFQKDGRVWFPGRGNEKALNRPRLNAERGSDRRAYADYKVLRAFTREQEAVVVQTLTAAHRVRLDRELGPWLRRYEDYVARSVRMRFGDVVVEPKAFERVLVDPVRVEWRSNALREPYLAVTLLNEKNEIVLANDRRIVPLDAENRALGDFLVGDAPAHEEVLRKARRVVTLLPNF